MVVECRRVPVVALLDVGMADERRVGLTGSAGVGEPLGNASVVADVTVGVDQGPDRGRATITDVDDHTIGERAAGPGIDDNEPVGSLDNNAIALGRDDVNAVDNSARFDVGRQYRFALLWYGHDSPRTGGPE